ncbi:MAG: hypothetical protein M3P98_02085 [bacterium]|nr:hypothetical protein [bacterium]
MDFIDPNKKRAHEIRLYIGYTLMTILVFLGVIVLLYASYGYGIDRRGNIVQTGLVFTDSKPTAANVTYSSEDGSKTDSFGTPRRLSLEEGIYDFTFSKDGYRDWVKKINLGRGDIERLVYAFLFPRELSTLKQVDLGARPQLVAQSPDLSRILVYNDQVFDVYDPSLETINDLVATFSPLKNDLFTDKIEKLTLEEWSTDNRHALIRHSYKEKAEYVLLDVEDSTKSINLNRTIKNFPAVKEITLFDNRPNEVYVLTNKNELKRIRVSDGRIVNIEVNVVDFTPHGNDGMVFVKNSTVNKEKADVFIMDKNEDYFVRELDRASEYIIETAQYENSWYTVVGAVGQNEAFVYKDLVESQRSGDPNQAPSTRTLRLDNIQDSSFSEDTQFIQVQSGQDFVVYDSLDDRQYRFTIDQPFDDLAKPAVWMDGHRLISATADTTVVFDFDGNNYQPLSKVVPGTKPYFDKDYKSYVSMEEFDGSFWFMKTPLEVKN